MHGPALLSIDGPVWTVTLNRPESRNAMNGELSRALRDVWKRFEDDPEALVVILTGAGDKAFCAGMDLKAFAAGEGAEVIEGPGGFGGLTELERTKPVIAAVNGAALGGGFELMLACDLVVAADHALFGAPEVRVGLMAVSGGALRLPRRIPRVNAMELLLTGRPIDARKALDLGLVNKVVPGDAVIDAARELAEAICANAPLAVRETLQLANAAAESTESADALWKRNRAAWERILASEDAVEGPRAFAEKRPPQWSGSGKDR